MNARDKNLSGLSRRQLLQAGVAGLTLAVTAQGKVWAATPAEAKKYGADSMPGGTVDDPLVFVSIADSGVVTIIAHRVEMGTGVRTSARASIARRNIQFTVSTKHCRINHCAIDYGNLVISANIGDILGRRDIHHRVRTGARDIHRAAADDHLLVILCMGSWQKSNHCHCSHPLLYGQTGNGPNGHGLRVRHLHLTNMHSNYLVSGRICT